MNKVESNPIILNLDTFVEPAKNPLLQRIVQVIKNTLFQLVDHLGPTIIAFAAIPAALTGPLYILALPVIWVAYCTFEGVKLLKEQEKIPVYHQALAFLTQVKADFDKENIEDMINKSTTHAELVENLKAVENILKKYHKRTENISELAFCNVFDMTGIYKPDVSIKDSLSGQKELIISLYLKQIREHFAKQLNPLLPGYIKLLEENFYEGKI